MSAAATARLRAIVDRIAVAAGVDPSKVTANVTTPRAGVWWAEVQWPDGTPLHATMQSGASDDEAIDAVIGEFDDLAEWSVSDARQTIAHASKSLALWSAVRAACEVTK